MSRSTDSKRPSPRRRITKRRRVDLLAMRPYLERLEPLLLLSTFTVDILGDGGPSGPGNYTLRQAINAANANPGADTINFALGGPAAIFPTSQLPDVTDTVDIDARGQSVTLDGASAGDGATGLTFAAGSDGSSLEGLTIQNFLTDGLHILSNANTIGGLAMGDGNMLSAIGHVDPMTGFLYGEGIQVSGGTGNVIEGNTVQTSVLSGIYILDSSTDPANNVVFDNSIVSNGDHGVELGNTSGNTVQGNAIEGNGGDGILLHDNASSNLIGGSTVTPGTGPGNIISGNFQNGIHFLRGSSSNTVQGNLIGLTGDGTAALGNFLDGVFIEDCAQNTIGSENVISGNSLDGVFIQSAGSTNNLIAGSFIGTDITGSYAVPNGANGVEISDAPNNVVDAVSLVGVISGNAVNGVHITGAGSTHNQVFGDRIGLDFTGTFVIPNGNDGVLIDNGASNNTIGSENAGAGNVISGNLANGIEIASQPPNDGVTPTTNNLVINNNIGTDLNATTTTGTDPSATPLGNSLSGVLITNSFGNTIGGVGAAAAEYRNVISGNDVANIGQIGGIRVENNQSFGNLIAGNFIGTDFTGNSALPNLNDGITLINGASFNTVGGTDSGARNVLSGNGGYGVALDNLPTSNNVIEGNYIGVGFDGSTPLGNATNGVGTLGSANNTIGGDASTGAGNVISNNGLSGVNLAFADSTGNVVTGNFIGTTADGMLAAPNSDGVTIVLGASGNTIGGLTLTPGTGLGNVISGNRFTGVHIDQIDPGSGPTSNNLVEGNLIGTDFSGTFAIGNGFEGVRLDSAGSGNIIGGDSTTGAGNVISGNSDTFGFGGGGPGVAVFGGGGAPGIGTLIAGNLIGTDINGTNAIFNGREGVYIGGSDTTVGGTTAGLRNVLSGNGLDGVQIANFFGFDTERNIVLGNFIGTDITGNNPLPNQNDGIHVNIDGINTPTSNNSIGSADIGGGNVIGGNVRTGVEFSGTSLNLALNNTIGMRADGTDVLGNGFIGLDINQGSASNTVGGTGPNTGNRIVVTDPGFFALAIEDPGSTGNSALGNTIGYNAAGTAAIGVGNGVYINSDHNTIGGTDPGSRNVIAGSNGYTAVWIANGGGNDNLVEGNYIGTTADGSAAVGGVGSGAGVLIQFGSGNTIGGTAPGAGNLISGNQRIGVELQTASGNLIAGNLVGTDSTGLNPVGNGQSGVVIDQGSTENTVGGITATLGQAPGNVIADNGGVGVFITDAGSDDNLVQGNLIGTDSTGLSPLGNGFWGIEIFQGANNTVGGSAAGEGNVLSGNNEGGIAIYGGLATADIVQGNFIGVGIDGSTPLGNGFSGVYVGDFGAGVGGATGNIIGGAGPGEGNVISNNGELGVWLTGGASNNLVAGNLIGTDLSGTLPEGNGQTGLLIDGGSEGNTIGGSAAGTVTSLSGAGNLISGNGFTGGGGGLQITDLGTTGNLVAGNFIGTDITGTQPIANNFGGVDLATSASENTIGGVVPGTVVGLSGAGNLISGNDGSGVTLDGSFQNLVAGNFIGTEVTGTTALPNVGSGIFAVGDAEDTIGGVTAGTVSGLSGAGNLISGNQFGGIDIFGSDDLVAGNFIGTDVTGTMALGNGSGDGVFLDGGGGNTIGGAAANPAGGFSGAGNLISGQSNANGIDLFAEAGDVISGNFIGTNVNGTAALPGQFTGIFVGLGGPSNELITNNLISGNQSYGIDLQGASKSSILANFIGTDASGLNPVANGLDGILLEQGSANNTIGDLNPDFTNVISANSGVGIRLEGGGTTGNLIVDNFVGTDATGTVSLGNTQGGVVIQTGASDNTLGGTTFGEGNVIAGNNGDGVDILDQFGDGTTGNVLQGNFIGTNDIGTANLANAGTGVLVGGAQDTTIGGSDPGAGNVISGNVGDGVDVFGSGTDGTVVQANLIGIDPTGTTALPNGIYGVTFSAGINLGDGVNNVPISLPGTPTNTSIVDNVISGNAGDGIEGGGAFTTPQTSLTTLTVTGNFIGTNAAGTVAVPNHVGGILLVLTDHITIGGTTAADRNIISGNLADGIAIADAATTAIAVEGNYIGLGADGLTPIGNGGEGVSLVNGTHDDTIGGTDPGAGNVISANAHNGILISDVSNTTAILVQGNFIGTDATGLIDALPGSDGMLGTADDIYLGNQFNGVSINDSPNNTIGGTTAGLNVISGNGGGVSIVGSNATGNLVAGNYIGVDSSGTAGFQHFDGTGSPTRFYGTGVGIGDGASQNTVGGTTDATRNVISGNDHGVVLGSGASQNVVEGNYIGPDKTGLVNVGQAFHDVRIGGGVDNTIGGTAAGAGNVIAGAGRESIYIEGAISTGDVFQGNFIGTDKNGINALGNHSDGLHIAVGANHITVGGSAPGAGNLISGNAGSGVVMDAAYGHSTHDNIVQGNTIGLDSAGAALPNGGNGVVVNQSYNNLIGGSAAGARNVVSANTFEGVFVGGASGDPTDPNQADIFAATGNVVAGNYIGTSTDGKAVRANGNSGVILAAGANHNTIGGDATTGFGNVISGNTFDGVTIVNIGTSNNLVAGNFIGTTADGKSALGNTDGGISLFSAASSNTIGGAGGLGNVISGNGNGASPFAGVNISSADTDANIVLGNKIGTDTTGLVALPNGSAGVSIFDHANNNIVGGAVGNLIAGNKQDGVSISTGSTGDLVAGNTIGLDSQGNVLGNTLSGVAIFSGASAITIGGTTTAARNVISGNGGSGVGIDNSSTILVVGNYIGTDATGTAQRANLHGVTVTDSASSVTIGGPAAGAANIISGNITDGVRITGGATGVLVSHNTIGLDSKGNTLGNTDGIYMFASGNTIDANVISGNTLTGIYLDGGSKNSVTNNFIGTDATGTVAKGNLATGIVSNNAATNNTIGGVGAGNVISGNGASIPPALPSQDASTYGHGIAFMFADNGQNVVQSNKIGTNLAGTAALPNRLDGIHFFDSARRNLIGGTAAGTGNLISGNGRDGVSMDDQFSNISSTGSLAGNLLEGNLIGTTADGQHALGNGNNGVTILDSASNNTIGGTVAGAGNVISGNHGYGIRLTDSKTSGNVIQGNDIGTDALGALALANLLDGVRFENGAANNLLGGSVASAANVIAFNTGNGVTVGNALSDNKTVGDSVLRNSIFSNVGKGNVLTGFPGNVNGGPHSGPNNLQNTPIISQITSNSTTTTIQGFINTNANSPVHLEFFTNPSGAQGKTFLKALDVMTVGNVANFSFTTASRLAPGVIVTATATVAGSTSQFSPAVTVAQIPDDVSALVTVTRGGYVYNRTTKRFAQSVTIKNNSGHTLNGPISLVIDNLPAGVTVFNPTGMTTSANPPAGSPYVDVVPLGGSLANGASVSVALQFVDPSVVTITYDTRVLAGPGTR